jgi:AcrR family transcriptional regulator
MKKRTAAVADTRQRILEATVKLHGKNGIFVTSWQDIAREADVAVGTVYKHFPSLEELVPACGELLMMRIRPPSPEDADIIIGEATEPVERLRRVAKELFAFYERGGSHLESDLRERELPAIREWEEFLRAMTSHFVRVALTERNLCEGEVQAISVLLDFSTYSAMRVRGITTEQAVEQAAAMIMAWIEHGREGKQSDVQ